MFSCDHLIHPFLNDPGTSQQDRVAKNLLEGSAQIDNRELSDLLNYLAKLSRQVNFYDETLSVSDWQPFFSGDLPFLLSSIAGYDLNAVNTKLGTYSKMFQKNPSPEGLQLIFFYSYYSIVHPIQTWSVQLQQSGLDLEQKIQKLISDRLSSSIKSFIRWMNTSVACFGIRPFVVTDLLENAAWGLAQADLTAYDADFSCTIKSRRSQLLSLFNSVSGLFSAFTEVIGQISSGAADPVNQNLYGLLQTSGQQDTSPHLALLYSFLNQFLHVLDNLNDLTQKHLDFFFQNILQLSPTATIPDKAYIIFAIQKKLKSYSLPQNLSLKDGKDGKQADIFFNLDAPLVVTQTQATDIRTLFVHKKVFDSYSYVEGVYMAQDATKADGISKPFKDPDRASWPSLGAKKSEYIPPGTNKIVDYPYARLGFILSSKILLMKEGTRKVHIQLACQWKDNCSTGNTFSNAFKKFSTRLCSKYLVITQEKIDQARVMGLREKLATELREYYLQDPCKKQLCEKPGHHYRKQALVRFPCCDFRKEVRINLEGNDEEKENSYQRKKKEGYTDVEKSTNRVEEIIWRYDEEMKAYCERKAHEFWALEMARFESLQEWEINILKLVFKEQWVFDVFFSGEQNWVVPDKINEIALELTDEKEQTFLLHIFTTIGSGQDAISFYNKDKLGEDFNTTDPLVRIQLNESIKIDFQEIYPQQRESLDSYSSDSCCLQRPADYCGKQISFYDFFRNITVLGKAKEEKGDFRLWDHKRSTKINIRVCGVTSLVVQNEQNVLDANKSFTPFGVKPIVVDFDVLPVPNNNNWGALNLFGPNFYIGSAEVFLKKWDRVCLNINWQNKPSDFDKYYSTYLDCVDPALVHFPDNQAHFSLLHNGNWQPENGTADVNFAIPALSDHFNRYLFSNEPGIAGCNKPTDFQYSFDLHPSDFGNGLHLKYDKKFDTVTKYATGTQNGFMGIRLEYADFLHQVFTQVYATQMAKIANKDPNAFLPNEPWTPTIQKGMSIDYEATATIKDIDLIQLYPYEGCYLSVDIMGEPKLFAEFCDEGNLFIGLDGLIPGEELNILFQLAEATADTEALQKKLNWQYLTNNQWQDLKAGFQVEQDDTYNLTRTGIVRILFPDDISNDNTILPSGLYWIKAAIPDNAETTSKTIAVLTQAARASFANSPLLNDQNRPATPLPKGSITKLTVSDASVTQISQPFDSFGGKAPEVSDNTYYLRVSERLKHKGRAIQKWDYERIVLQQFPKVLRVKCINHSYSLDSHSYKWDFPMSPGNVIIAVLPDINQLAVSDTLHPTVPLSMLSDIENYLGAVTSPFVQVFVKNPRYEPVDLCIHITLRNSTDKKFYESKLQEDITDFMAPWKGENLDAFRFARRLYLSDLADFINSLDYISVLIKLRMCHEGDQMAETAPPFLDPLTPRSILVAGRMEIIVDLEKSDGQVWKKRLKKI